MENLAEGIQEERRKRKLPPEHLSPKTGLSESFLSRVERGLTQPSLRSLKKFSQQFGVSGVSFFADLSSNHTDLKFHPSFEAKKTNPPLYVNEVKVARRALLLVDDRGNSRVNSTERGKPGAHEEDRGQPFWR